MKEKLICITIGERLMDNESYTEMVAKVDPNLDLTDKLNNLLLDWYADSVWEDEDLKEQVWTPQQSICWIDGVEILTPEEFNLLSSRGVINMTNKLYFY